MSPVNRIRLAASAVIVTAREPLASLLLAGLDAVPQARFWSGRTARLRFALAYKPCFHGAAPHTPRPLRGRPSPDRTSCGQG